ncbi:hypothetical protein ABEB36_001576 [Hypothenemus hampei]|uniref:Odorant receptor n=1 Tax=Hypothenemus hampei TaxID=57062 RepID=A0ABD1FHI7_HYPHA
MDDQQSTIKDNRSILKYLQTQMIVGGFLPSFKIENWILQKMFNFVVHLLRFYYMAIVALMCFELFHLLPRGDMENVTRNMSLTIPGILMVVKLFVLKSRNAVKLLNTIIEEEYKIFSCESISIHNIYFSSVTHAQNCTKIFNIMSLLCGFAIFIATSLSGLLIEQLQKPLLILDQLSFNEFNKQNHYGLYLTNQNIWIVLATLYYNLFLNFYVTLLAFVKAQMKIYFSVQQLSNHIYRLVNDVNKALKWWLFVEFALSSISIASVIIQVTLHSSSMVEVCTIPRDPPCITFVGFTLVVVITLFIQQFILAWFANDVAVESVRISESIYSLEWYKASTNIQILFKVAILRSQKPLFIYLGNFKPLTTQTSLSGLYNYARISVNIIYPKADF